MSSWTDKHRRICAHSQLNSAKEGEVTVHIFLGDAVGPDEGGQAADVPLEDALVDGEVQAVARQDDRVLVVVTDNRGSR